MKLCRVCNTEKSLDNFHRRGDGHRTECKVCKSIIDSKRRRRESDGYYSVYYLPEHHYIGMTNCIKVRMQEHRNKSNRFTEGYEIIGVYKKAVDAHLAETIMHSIGYKGFYYKGIKNE